jgi:hypothetical protein
MGSGNAGATCAAGQKCSAGRCGCVLSMESDFETCVVRTDKTLWCWNPSTGSQPTAVATSLGATITQVATGSSSDNCAISNESAWCWGTNYRLGNGSMQGSSVPVQPALPLGRYAQVAMDYTSTCALRSDDRSIWCWGSNGFGQLGDGTMMGSNPGDPDNTVWLTPIQGAATLAGTVTQIAKGTQSSQTCALTQSGKAWCWGAYSLGDGSQQAKASPVQVATAGTFLKLASQAGSQGNSTNCGLKSDNSVWCWGLNFAGEIGDGTGMPRLSPVKAASSAATTFLDVATGPQLSCAVAQSGDVWCWGLDVTIEGQDAKLLGGKYAQIRVGANGWICGLKQDGTVWCWQKAGIASATRVSLACP